MVKYFNIVSERFFKGLVRRIVLVLVLLFLTVVSIFSTVAAAFWGKAFFDSFYLGKVIQAENLKSFKSNSDKGDVS